MTTMVVFVLRMTTEAEANAEPMQPLVIGKDIKNSLISLYKADVTTSWWYVIFLAKRRHDVMTAVSELIFYMEYSCTVTSDSNKMHL